MIVIRIFKIRKHSSIHESIANLKKHMSSLDLEKCSIHLSFCSKRIFVEFINEL